MATLAAPQSEIALIRSTRLHGRRTTGLLRRTLLVYLGAIGVGLVPTLLHLSSAWQAAGLGLIVPGGGFLSVGGWWLAAIPLAALLFLLGMGLWLFTGNLVAPFAVWLGAAGIAGGIADGPPTRWSPYVAVALAFAFLGRTFVGNGNKLRKAAARRETRNQILPGAVAALWKDRQPAPAMNERELSAEDLRGIRYLLGLSLQPLGQFAGFVRKDSFQPAALRYQLNHIQYTLSVVQCQYTPNFHGYLSAAQRFTIESLQLPEVCGYWKLESMWGNLRWNPDPVDTKDNIMLTGWSGQCLGTYAANTGDRRYGEKNSLVFRPFKGRGSKAYGHDHHAFAQSLLANWERAPLFLFPCEPNFVYSQCNMFGYGALVSYDRAFGTNHTAAIHTRFRDNFYEEFELPDGEIQPILSDLTGLSMSFKPTVTASVSAITLINVFDQPLAERMYALVRAEEVGFDESGALNLTLQSMDQLDPGNYTKGTVFCHAWLAASAYEMGDYEVAEKALARIAADNKQIDNGGALQLEGVSVSTMANYVLARVLRRDYWRDTVLKGPLPSAFTGPLLAECCYPDVLVARAWSPNGNDLDMVLYDGNGSGTFELQFQRLTPGAAYVIEGDQNLRGVADGSGGMSVQVTLAGRTQLQLKPE